MRRVLFVCILLAACKTIPPVDPPEFDYPGLARLAETAPGRTIPLTIQRGANLHPVSSQTGFLFYSSNRDGSGDIWMRDLHNTVAFPVIKHPAEQGKPAVPLNGQKLAFVSFDTDAGGDIRIVEIKPDSIIKDSLAGSTPPNLWDSSDSLSEQVVQASKQLPPACRGAFAETDPVFSGDGKYLYYVSDRCTPGTFNIWRMELKGVELKGTPEIISQKGGVQPALSYDGKRITYVSYRSGHAEIYVQDLQTRQEILVRTGGGILQYPALSPDGAIVFYIAVREDTNQNGSLDAMDKAGIYSAPVAGGREARLVDPSTSLHGLYFSLFLGGTLLYSAESYQNISVYFVRPEGVIPRQADIEEQYLFASRFLREPGKRTIALDALERFFGGTKEFILYEGKYLQSRVDTLIGDERKAAEEELKEARARNPFAEYQLTLAALPRQKSRVEFIQEFLKKTESSDLQNEQRTLIVPAVLDDLSKAQESEGDKPGALESLVRIDKEFPTYYRRARIRLREAVLELKVTGKIPAVAMEELQAKPSIQRREEILTEIVNYFGRIRKPDDLDAAVSKELERADLIPLIRSTLEYLRARSLYDRGRDEEALTLARNLQTGLPQESGMYVRTWQLLAFLFERRRDYAGAYEARLRYGGAYRPDTGVKIGLDEYREILEQSDRTIKRTLASARSIAAVVDEQDAVISRTLLSRTLEGTPVQTLLNQVRQNPIELSASDREALHDLCFGNTGAIIGNLGKPEYVKTFVQFCKDAEPYLKGKNEGGMNLEFARTGSDLLYLVSYSNVNILNILFYNMKRVNLFEKFHEENSIKYHRLKVDIAMERNRNRIEWDRRQVAILDPRNVIDLFSEGDPFDATSFNEVVHGYKFAATEARSVGELSFVYGYAYALIQKSVERDRFYDRSAKEGITIPEDVRRAKKQDTLRDLKTAEYLLQYILFVKPDNADAYLQLGWLYQYIDDRRSRNIPTAETFVVRVVNYLTRTSAPRATDGQYYIDIYRAYFPDRLYENNVELYRQAIQLIGFLNSTDPALPDLHLNLANNYFQLLNFKKAIDHFNQNEDLRRTVGGASDPVRTGLFYFNRGRAYYYEGQTTSASRDLKKALEMYTSSDLSPAEELVEGIRFRITDVGEKSENMARLKVRLEDGQKRLDNARLRVAMIGALYALSLYESGRYAESSRAYETADAQIRRMQEPANELRAGILNFLALARQNQSRIESSDIQAIASRDLSKEIGLSRQDARYQPQSIGGRLLGCLLTYGEDFSVIGEGRNPYGLAPLRQYELSLGILLENRILAGDRSGAFEILSQRRDIFDGKDGDVNLGRIGLITADNQRAYEEFLSGHYESAQKLFANAGENARSHGFLDQARRNYINRYQALFALFESGDDALPRMKGALADLDEFRSVYREKAKEEYISQKQTEDPAFEYEPAIDDPILESQLTRRLQDFVVVEANLHYYSGYSLDRRATSPADLTQARAHYTKALELYDRLIAGQQDEATSPVHFRVRLNRGVILSRLGRIEQAMNVLSRMIEELEEFALSGEEWFARRALANLAAARFFERGRPSDAALAREQYIRAAEILTEDPTVRKGLIGMQEFYEDAADFFAASGDPQKANQLLEQSWVYALQEDYLRYPISFESTALTETYEKYLSASRTARALAVREQSLRFGRKDSKVAREEKMRALASLETARESMRSAVPLHEAFLSSPVSSPDLRKGQWMIRLFYRGHTLSVFAFLPGFAYYREDGNPEAALKTILNRLPRRVPSALLVIADQETWSLNLEAAIQSARPDLPVPLFVTRMSDPGVLYSEIRPELNQFNTLDANSDFEASDVFIVEREFADDFFAIENGRFQARQFLQKRHNASMAVTDEPSRNFNKIRTAYELFRAGGVGSLVIRQSKGPLPAQNQKLTGQGFRVMGSEGFRTDAVMGNIRARYAAALDQAGQFFSAREFRRAAEQYRLASSLAASMGEKGKYLEARLKSASALMTVDAPAADRAFAQLLAGELDAAQKSRVHAEGVKARFRTGRFKEAEVAARVWAEAFPAEKSQIDQQIRLVVFLRNLESENASDKFHDGSFATEFRALLSDLAQPEVAPSAIDLLLRRGFHSEAASIARLQRPAERKAALARINFSQRLAEGKIPQEAPRDVFDENEPGLAPLAAYRARVQSGEIISGVEIREDVNPTTLSPVMRSLLVQIYLEASDSDPGYLIARLLREAIELEKGRSPERASLMALCAAERYLAFGDVEIADLFFNNSRDLAKVAIADPERSRRLNNLQRILWWFSKQSAPEGAEEGLPSLEEEPMEAFLRSLDASQVPYGLRALKARALREHKYSLAVEINSAEQKGFERRGKIRPFVQKLQQNLPASQSVTVILESEMKIHRIRIGKDVDHDVWDKSARELRTRIARSVHMRERGDDADLARVFRAMVPAPINRSTYVYLSSGFLLAPIYSEPGDRIFVVTDLERLARPAVPMDARFAGDFKVFIPGRKALESADSSDRTWDERAARMEELAVGISGSTPGISHLMNPLALSSRIEGAWFSSVPRHGDSALQTVVKYESDLIQALHSASAPGVFYAETGASEWAVRFIRFYYDRESGMTMVDRRYMDAQIRLRREGMGPLNVRLATPVLISD